MQDQRVKISLLCDIYGALLTERQRDMLRLFYDYDNSLSEIAQQYSITRQGVFDCINKAEEALFNFENALKLLEKKEKITACLLSIKEDIKDNNADIMKNLETISKLLGE